SPAGSCATDAHLFAAFDEPALRSRVAQEPARVAQARDSLDPRQSRRPPDLRARPRVRPRLDAARGRRRTLHRIPRCGNGVLEHDEQRHVRSDVLAFSRMHVQHTWDAIMNAPVDLDDVVLAELAWAASKSVLSGVAI